MRVSLHLSGSGRITSREEYDVSVWKIIPGFAKIIILLQTVVILFLSFWIYQEYLNNSYLQVYLSGNLQGISFSGIVLVSIGLFTIVAIALYARLRSTRRELEGITSTEAFRTGGRGRGQPVDTRTEQHLIEMIRKTMPIMDSRPKTDGPMPTLSRKDSRSKSEE